MALSIPQPTSVAASSSSSPSYSVYRPKSSSVTFGIFDSPLRFLDHKPIILKSLVSFKNNSASLRAVKEFRNQALETTNKQTNTQVVENEQDLFREMKQRFLSFKKDKYLENIEYFENLAKEQKPKFMVIACADSRVCPSSILGFQPGEAFVVRNIANLVPPYQNGPTEANAALEFAVNFLEVENILVVGHSCCGGIKALMSMADDDLTPSNFISNWVRNGKHAKISTRANASSLNFDQQCRHCEKVSINQSLLNLLSYPWIEEKMAKEMLSVHGGYYDFVDCTFEKWTLDHKGTECKPDGEYSIRNREFWC